METKRRIRLIAFDLDGTTLRGRTELSDRNRIAMEKADAAGVLVVPATGRLRSFLPPALAELPCLHYAITSNGAAVWDLKKNERICTNLIPTHAALQVQRVLADYELFVEYYVNGRAVVETDEPERARTVYGLPESKYYFLTKDYLRVEDVKAYLEQNAVEPEKINLMYIPDAIYAEVLARLQQIDGLEITFSNVDNIEINAKGCDKGLALLALCEKLGIDPEETLAVGDNGNDLAMLRAAGIAAVVGNGIEEAKQAADAVVAPCLEDGFAEAVEGFVL